MVGGAGVTFLAMLLAIWSSAALVGVSAALLGVTRGSAVIAVSIFLAGASIIVLPQMMHVVSISP